MDDEQFGTTKDYMRAFETIRNEGLSDKHTRLLQAHMAAPGHATTWTQLAEDAGYQAGRAVNLQYGKLAERVARHLGLNHRMTCGAVREWNQHWLSLTP